MQALWILLITILAGCSASGGYIPVVPMEMKKDMVNELNVTTSIYVEALTDRGSVSKKFMYKGREVPVVLNLDEMSMYVANSLSAELVKRGAALNRNADKIIKVEVLDADISYGANYLVAGSLTFHLSDGASGSCSFGASGVKAHRALSGALQWGVANIMNHEKVRAFLQPRDAWALPEEGKAVISDYGSEAKFKLAVLPFMAGSFDDRDENRRRVIEALIESTHAVGDIALTHSCYNFGDNGLAKYRINQIDAGETKEIWERNWGKYVPAEGALRNFASSQKIDLLFICSAVCTKGGTYCPEVEVETFIYSAADNKMFRQSVRMRHNEQADNLAYIHNYYSYDKFYAEIKRMSSSLLQEFLNGKQKDPAPKSPMLQ